MQKKFFGSFYCYYYIVFKANFFRDIVAAFKCFPICVYDISLPVQIVEFYDATNWMKIELDTGNLVPDYQIFVQSMNALSKVWITFKNQPYVLFELNFNL